MSAERCKQRVWRARGLSGPCAHRAVRDGYCGNHHPDAVARRRKTADEAWRDKMDRRGAQHRRQQRARELADLIVRDADAGRIMPETVDAWIALARRAVEGLE